MLTPDPDIASEPLVRLARTWRTYVAHLGHPGTSLQFSVTVLPDRDGHGISALIRGNPSDEAIADALSAIDARLLIRVSATELPAALEWLVVAFEEELPAAELAHMLRYGREAAHGSDVALYAPSQVGNRYPIRANLKRFVEWVAMDDLVPVSKSPLEGKALAGLVASGASVLAVSATGDPLLLVYTTFSWVIVRVGDPILGALGEVLAEKVRHWLAESGDELISDEGARHAVKRQEAARRRLDELEFGREQED
jgi:hypothetical protein